MASANNTLVGAVRVDATLESGKFVDGAKKIRQETQKTEAVVKSGFSGMGTAIKGFGGAVTAGLSLGLLTGLATKAIQYAQSIKTVAAQLGVTTKELQEFRYAAQQVGVTVPEADKALEKLGVSMSKGLAQSKPTIAAFKAVGVEVADLKTKSQTEIFGQIADQMNKQGGAAKNAAAGTVLMGEGFNKLIPLADKGSAGINELAAAAQRLGVVLSDQQIQNADETARKLNDVKMVLAAQISGVVADNAQSITTLAQALAQLTSSIVNFLGSNPQAALGIIGALAGARFGAAGAAAGGIGGLFVGGQMAQSSREANSDVRFRVEQTKAAKAEFDRRNVKGNSPQYIKFAEDKLRKETALLLKATKALEASRSPQARPGLPVPEFLASDPKTGRKARTPRAPKAPRDRSDDVAYQFEQELRRSQMDVLRAQQSLTSDYVERRNIGVQLLELQREEHEAELANRVRLAERDAAEGKITAGTLEQVKVQADQLRLEYDKKHALEIQALNAEEEAKRREEVARLSDLDYDIAREKLDLEASLAETAAEQRDVALRMLDLWEQQERAKLNTIMAENEIGSLAWEEARRRRVALDQTAGARREGVEQGTRGPMEDYLASLPGTTEKWNEALEEVEVRGLQSLEDGLMSIIDGTKSVGEAFRDMANQIIQDLIRIAIQKMIVAAIGGGFSGGGEVGAVGMASGGFVSGPGGPTADRIPAMLSNGEFVINAKSTKKFLPLLKGINDGEFARMATGGIALPRTQMGERIKLANDNGNTSRGGVTFDLRGAVMTEDLLKQMNQIGAQAADQGGNLGVQRMRDLNERTFGRASR